MLFHVISQAGVLMQLLGASWLVYAAYKGFQDSKNSSVQQAHWSLENEDRYESLEHRVSIIVQEVQAEFVANAHEQWKIQLVGFIIFALGLVMQFIGGIK